MSALTTAAAAAAAVALAAALEQLDAVFSAERPSVGDAVEVPRGLRGVAPPAGVVRHAVAGAVAGCVAMFLTSALLAIAAGGVAVGASMMRSRRAALGRVRACEAATPALARVLADALRGGDSIRAALLGAGDDRSIPEALRQLVASEARALSAGAALRPVLQSLSVAGGSSLRLLCGTVALHSEAGGRLSSELDRLARAAEDARRVEHDRVAATAQARATVRVVGMLPLLALGGAQLASPSFLAQVAGNPIALGLLLLGLVLEIVAFLAARAIVGTGR